MMTSAQVVETSVNVTSNSPSQDYTHPDDHNLPNYEEINVKKIFAVINATYAVAKRKEGIVSKFFETLSGIFMHRQGRDLV